MLCGVAVKESPIHHQRADMNGAVSYLNCASVCIVNSLTSPACRDGKCVVGYRWCPLGWMCLLVCMYVRTYVGLLGGRGPSAEESLDAARQCGGGVGWYTAASEEHCIRGRVCG